MTIHCYPTPSKTKALNICRAFAEGCGGKVVEKIPRELLPGPAFFYGVTPATAHLFEQAKREGRDWLYADNAYTDPQREVYFRVTRNRLQHDGFGDSDGKRFAALNLHMEPWRDPPKDGHILVCPQSDEFMRVVVGYKGSWADDVSAELRKLMQRQIVIRPWNRNKAEHYRTLPHALEKCYALVTWSSASAITAIMRGIPAICLADDCIARPVAGHFLDEIESPPVNADRRAWANVLADHQFTLDEMRDGTCWRMLNAQPVRAAA